MRLAHDPVDQQDFPRAVVAAPGVPLHGFLVDPAQRQPFLYGLAELRSGVLAGAAHGRLAGPLRHERALGEDRALEAAYAVDGDARELGDLLRGGTGSYAGLDVAGAEVALHLDLDLVQACAIVAYGSPKPLVDRKRVLRAVRSLEHQSCAVI